MISGAASSAHPIAAEAAGEVVGRLADCGGADPALVVVMSAGEHGHFHGELSATVARLLRPGAIVSVAVPGIAPASGRPVQPAIIAWAVWTDDAGVHALEQANPAGVDSEPGGHLVVAERGVLGAVGDRIDRGGTSTPMAGASLPDDAELRLDGHGVRGVIVTLTGADVAAPVVSTAARAVGPERRVTDARGRVVLAIDDRPAAEVLLGDLDALASGARRRLATHGIHLARGGRRVGDPDGAGDLLLDAVGDLSLYPVAGVDRGRGAAAVDRDLPVGTVVRLAARDRDVEVAHLARQLDGLTASGAVVFSDRSPPAPDPTITAPAGDGDVVADAFGASGVAEFTGLTPVGRRLGRIGAVPGSATMLALGPR